MRGGSAAAKPRGRRDAHTILRHRQGASGATETDAEPTDTIRPIARRLTRPQGDRGHKLVRTIVARPGVPNAPSQIECRFFSDQQNASAARAFGAAKIVGSGFRSSAGESQGHRRFSATLPHTPSNPMVYLAWPLWRCHDAIMKLSWPAGADFGRNDNSRARICIKLRSALQFWRKWEFFGATLWRISAGGSACSVTRGAVASLHCSTASYAPLNQRRRRAARVHSAARASACCRKRGMTSTAMSCIDCRSQASLGPSQSTPVMSRVPKGPTSSRNATSLSSRVLGEP